MEQKMLEKIASQGHNVKGAELVKSDRALFGDISKYIDDIGGKISNGRIVQKSTGALYFAGETQCVINGGLADFISTFFVKSSIIIGGQYGVTPGILIYSPDDEAKGERTSIWLPFHRTTVGVSSEGHAVNIYFQEDMKSGGCYNEVEFIDGLDEFPKFMKKCKEIGGDSYYLGERRAQIITGGPVFYLPKYKNKNLNRLI